MGWWGTGANDDVIGDGPADLITTALDNLALAAVSRSKAKPTVEEILDGIAAAIRARPEYLFGEVGYTPFKRLVASLEPGSVEIVGGEYARADAGVQRALLEAFTEIVLEYENSELERKPRLSELLSTLAFVLSAEPDRCLSLPDGVALAGIETR